MAYDWVSGVKCNGLRALMKYTKNIALKGHHVILKNEPRRKKEEGFAWLFELTFLVYFYECIRLLHFRLQVALTNQMSILRYLELMSIYNGNFFSHFLWFVFCFRNERQK